MCVCVCVCACVCVVHYTYIRTKYIGTYNTVFPQSNAAATNFFPSAETSGDYSRAVTNIFFFHLG